MTDTEVDRRVGTDTDAALRLEGVRKTYQVGDDEVVALDRADLTVGSDEIVALVGPSGSGKTTLCSIAGGILTPTEGAVVVGGQDISDYSSKQLTQFRRDAGVWSIIGNVLWILVLGWELAIAHLVAGLLLCLTIIGIPFGIACWKMVPLALLPLGQHIVPVLDGGQDLFAAAPGHTH